MDTAEQMLLTEVLEGAEDVILSLDVRETTLLSGEGSSHTRRGNKVRVWSLSR